MTAEALGVSPEKIEMVLADTGTSEYAGSVSASRMTFMAGNAIQGAARKALKNWRDENRPAVGTFGKLDVLYNNIGGGWVELDKKLHEISQEAFDVIIQSNLEAVYNTSRAAVNQMLKQGHGGSIINVTASENVRRMANPVYAYTKAGMIEMALNMANDYLQDGIRVNCLCPGLFEYEPIKDPVVKPISKNLVRKEPITERQGHPTDMAYAALFFASDESSFITGQCLTVDGGDNVKLKDLVIDI
jgi:3-oxoacyl-[acyl-carrier protein] reductase